MAAVKPSGTLVDERSKSWTFKTNRFGTPSELVDPLSNKTQFSFNAAGQPAKITLADPDGGGSQTSPVTTLGYNASGDLVRQYNPDGSLVSRTYDTTFHQLLSETDEVGRKTVYTLDSSGNRLTMKEADDANFIWSYQYTSRGQVSQITTPDPDGAGGPLTAAVTQLAYSSTTGQLLTITNPDSTTQGFTYNSADQMLTATNELSQVTTFEYDALDRRTKVIDATAATTMLAYDAIGQLVKTTDALGGVTDFAYNNRNWQTSITYPDPDGASSLPRPVHTFAYDAAGNVLTETDSQWTSGTQVTHVYNDAGWRTSTTGPVSGATVVTSYDNLGRVKSIEDARDNVTDIEYNSRGWRTKVTQPDPDGSGSATRPVWQWSYNYAGDTLTETDARGYITTYTYGPFHKFCHTDLA